MKNIFGILLFSLFSFSASAELVFAHINEPIMPIDRGEKYEDPLDDFLQENEIGEVTGGGSSLTELGDIEWVGIDIQLKSPHENIAKVVRKLRELGAPNGSYLEYSVQGKSYKVPVK
ncbi:hypothetical protein ACONUD_10090 [Microbulbifer harenosus]|uniref:Uncharacterized protein n=1 Tax=Microbulbifer harenosus TaxID=2576840 RepID=A0ABY2UCJ6_9GAMM|nr:hypothetical protein [Microbulbifer harenosus]TLM73388.1 hypothetical protein FDY93_19045 [Microbulbifer harenosus]